MKAILVLLVFSSLIVLTLSLFITPPKALAATAAVDLKTTANFAVLGGSAISDTPNSVITGNVGLSPGGGTSITGLKCAEVTGTIYDTNGGYTGNPSGTTCLLTDAALLTTAKNDLTNAYNDAVGRTPTTTYSPIYDLGGKTLGPGVYNDPSSFGITGTLTLDGGGDADAVFIFQAGSTLTTASSSKVVLTNSAQACNVFWQIGSSVTLGTSTTFVGNVLAFTSITDDDSSNVNGRLLARNGAVTLSHTTITKSTCAAGTVGGPAASSTSTSTSTTGSTTSTSNVYNTIPFCPPINYVIPTIIESRRIDANSIFIRWAPYSGTNTFNVQYGFENGKWLYSTDVTGFSTTIRSLPSNQPVWIQVAARSNCIVGSYGESMLVGGPSLPNTGFSPHENNIPWHVPISIGVAISALFVLVQRKYRFSFRH